MGGDNSQAKDCDHGAALFAMYHRPPQPVLQRQEMVVSQFEAENEFGSLFIPD
jgi:hypothetical protein